MAKNKQKPLGIGLEALIPKYQTKDDSVPTKSNEILLSYIIPNENQPRSFFSDNDMEELISSIKENGIIQPLTIRKISNKKYELISGERRYRAAKFLKLEVVPVYIINVKNDDDMLKLALIENIQRQNLSSIEEAEGYALLKGKYGHSDKDIAKKVGKNRSTIANKLRLIKLPPDLKNALRLNDKDFTEGHARALLPLRESKKMKSLFRRIKKNKLSVRQTEEFVKNKSRKLVFKKDKLIIKDKYLTKIENTLISHLATKVTVSSKSKNGSMKIHFSNQDDLERILDLILNEN